MLHFCTIWFKPHSVHSSMMVACFEERSHLRNSARNTRRRNARWRLREQRRFAGEDFDQAIFQHLCVSQLNSSILGKGQYCVVCGRPVTGILAGPRKHLPMHWSCCGYMKRDPWYQCLAISISMLKSVCSCLCVVCSDCCSFLPGCS